MNTHNTRGTIYRPLIFAITLVTVIYAVKQLFPILDGKEQYDFRTYYYAAQAYERGFDPYELQSLRDVSGHGIILTFIYPPHFLFILKPLCRFSYSTAYFIFLAAKLLALGVLIRIWSLIVPTKRGGFWALVVTTLLGYQGAVMVDLVAGNLSIFEQVLIWGGIYFLLRDKTVLGCISILLSSIVKLLTIVLGPLVFIIGRSAKNFFVWLYVTLAFCLLFLAAYLSQPELWSRFISSTIAASFYEKGHLNPSSLVLSKDIAGRLGFGNTTATIVYIIWCVFIVCVWLWAFRKTHRSEDRYPILYITLLAYVVISPKMMLYSLMIALLPTLHTISAVVPKRYRLVACALLWVPLFTYQPLILAAGTLAVLLIWIYKNRDKPEAKMELTLNPLRDFKEVQL